MPIIVYPNSPERDGAHYDSRSRSSKKRFTTETLTNPPTLSQSHRQSINISPQLQKSPNVSSPNGQNLINASNYQHPLGMIR
jgi:hypothetical protein